MSDSTDDEELAADVEELVDVLEELQEELRPRRRGPLGLPAPPSPGELLRFADRQAIPFAIAVLEANVRALELLQGAIRLVESGRKTGEEARRARDRAASLSRRSLERLDGVLSDLEASASDGGLQRPGEAGEILSEARRLRAEIENALASGVDDEPPDGGSPEDPDAEPGDPVVDAGADPTVDGSGDDSRPEVDVEGELRTIKEELGKLEEPADEDVRREDDETDSGTTDDADAGQEDDADSRPKDDADTGQEDDDTGAEGDVDSDPDDQ